MVEITKAEIQFDLAQITRQEVERYAGNAHQARLFPVLDDHHQTYAVVIIPDDPAERPAWVIVMARVIGDKIVVEEDRSLNKPLVDALLHNAGVPREQIVLVYAGEQPP